MPPTFLEHLVPAFAFLYGAVVGSFLNVVIYRLPRAEEGLSVTRPRHSRCPRCEAPIRWYDNIPLLSYLWLGGRCRGCREPISIRYFMVELLTGALFAFAAYVLVAEPLAAGEPAQWAVLLVYAALLAAMVAVTFIDIDHQIIPDRIDKPGMVLALPIAALVPQLHLPNGDLATLAHGLALLGLPVPAGFGLEAAWLEALLAAGLGIAAGAGVIYGVGLLGKALFRKEAMGFGDVKYMGMLGGFLGWKGVLLALLVACFAGALVGILVKVFTRDSYIPFGPFLSAGALGVLFWRDELLWVLFEWYPGLVTGM